MSIFGLVEIWLILGEKIMKKKSFYDFLNEEIYYIKNKLNLTNNFSNFVTKGGGIFSFVYFNSSFKI